MKLIEWARESFGKNPWAWILAGLLGTSVYYHYRSDSDLQTICTDVSDMTAPFAWERLADWQKQEMTEVDTLCGQHEEVDTDDDD